jgi:hypothetical protein
MTAPMHQPVLRLDRTKANAADVQLDAYRESGPEMETMTPRADLRAAAIEANACIVLARVRVVTARLRGRG